MARAVKRAPSSKRVASGPDDLPLLAAICATPDEDAPRVVYADHLLERGDPRGEFIQLQLSSRRALKGASGHPIDDPSHPVPPDHEERKARELALFKKHAKEWISPVRAAMRTWFWKRGFLDDIMVGPPFFAGAPALLASHPVTTVRFEGLDAKAFTQLAKLELGSIRSITVYGRQLNDKTAVALSNPNLAELSSLAITYSEIGADGLAALAGSRLRSLRQLSISGTFGDAGLAALATSTAFESLERVTFIDPTITDAGLVAFAAAPHFPRLAAVILEVPAYGSAAELVRSVSRAGIQALVARFGDAGVETYYGKRFEV